MQSYTVCIVMFGRHSRDRQLQQEGGLTRMRKAHTVCFKIR